MAEQDRSRDDGDTSGAAGAGERAGSGAAGGGRAGGGERDRRGAGSAAGGPAGGVGGPSGGPSSGRGRAERGWSDTLHGVQEAVGDMMGEVLDGVRDVASGRRFPRVDVIRREGEGYRIHVDLPGVQKGHLEVTTMGGEITVAGRRTPPEAAEDGEVLRSERGHGTFRRSVRLPPDARADEVRATLEDGVLVIRVPLAERDDARRVEID